MTTQVFTSEEIVQAYTDFLNDYRYLVRVLEDSHKTPVEITYSDRMPQKNAGVDDLDEDQYEMFRAFKRDPEFYNK